MTLPPPPDNWNIDRLTTERMQAIAAFGFTERRYAATVPVGPLHRGRLFHVGYKPLYAAIGQTDNRHRKPTSLGRLVARLMVLDAVLADRAFTWLGTEAD